MTEKFNKCLKFVLDREGRSYENNSADPGGETKFGISKKSYPNVDIKHLTEEQAGTIYLRDYWIPLNCEDYIDPRLSLALFDCGVNQGVGTAKQILDKTALIQGNEFTVEQFLLVRLRFYFNLCQRNPKLFTWLKDRVLRIIKISEYQF